MPDQSQDADLNKQGKDVLKLLGRRSGPLGFTAIAEMLNVQNGHRVQLKATLRELENAGYIRFHKGEKYGLASRAPEKNDHRAERKNSPRQFDAANENAAIPEAPRGKKAPVNLVGELVEQGGQLFISPLSRKGRELQPVRGDVPSGTQPGDIVVFTEPKQSGQHGSAPARVEKRLGSPSDVGMYSLIAIAEQGIVTEFSDAAKAQALAISEMGVPQPGGIIRDLRDKTIFAIDPVDARDHDDAIGVEIGEKKMRLFISIANVAHYIPANSPIDREARERGNSTYFPDRVNHMLPTELSADLCSLKGGVDRLTITAEAVIDYDGNVLEYSHYPAIIHAPAAISYQQAEDAVNGRPDATTAPLQSALRNIRTARLALEKAYHARGALDLDQAERKTTIKARPIPTNDLATEETAGRLPKETISIEVQPKLESMRDVQLFMLLANHLTAVAIQKAGKDGLFRVHPAPTIEAEDDEKIKGIREELTALGIQDTDVDFASREGLQKIVDQAIGLPAQDLIVKKMIRLQSQARYSTDNTGHFALADEDYLHFTSPIRRYADKIVQEKLNEIFNEKAKAAGLTAAVPLSVNLAFHTAAEARSPEELAEIADHVSDTERRSDRAERKAQDRYAAALLAAHEGEIVQGVVSSVSKLGVFVDLTETGVNAFMPMANLAKDDYVVDGSVLTGKMNGVAYCTGAPISVRLKEVIPVVGRVILAAVNDKGAVFAPLPARDPAPSL